MTIHNPFAKRWGMSPAALMVYCPTIEYVAWDTPRPGHDIITLTLHPRARLNRTKKYIEHYVGWNKIVGFRVDVITKHHGKEDAE